MSLSCNKTLNMLDLYVFCINRMSFHKNFTQNVQKLAELNLLELRIIVEIDYCLIQWLYRYHTCLEIKYN